MLPAWVAVLLVALSGHRSGQALSAGEQSLLRWWLGVLIMERTPWLVGFFAVMPTSDHLEPVGPWSGGDSVKNRLLWNNVSQTLPLTQDTYSWISACCRHSVALQQPSPARLRLAVQLDLSACSTEDSCAS